MRAPPPPPPSNARPTLSGTSVAPAPAPRQGGRARPTPSGTSVVAARPGPAAAAPADRARSTSAAPAVRRAGGPCALYFVSHIRHPRPRPEGRAHTCRPVRRTRWRPGTGAPCAEAQGERRRRDSRVYGPRDAARRATRVRRMPPPPTTTLSLSAANLKRASQSGRDSRQRRTASPALGPQVKASRSRSPSIITASINAAGGRVRLVMPKADRA